MEQVITTEKLPVKMWLKDIEPSALVQAQNLANLPFAFKHIAIMPDSHSGYGMPIGGVLATKGEIVPNAVGVDIGCGMTYSQSDISSFEIPLSAVNRIVRRIKEEIPVGFNQHPIMQGRTFLPFLSDDLDVPIVRLYYSKARHQIGTLGGGNHFIELQADMENGHLGVMIHSGSRHLGKKVADHYGKLAKQYNEDWYSVIPKNWELAFFPHEIPVARDYWAEMQYCVKYACFNRALMLHRVKEIINDNFPGSYWGTAIDCPHNYASWEHHFGKNVLVYRKGAIRAREGDLGIIPGSMGTNSYIVKGLGNTDSFTSCSHGAGRVMSRTQAKAELSLIEEQGRLDSLGVHHELNRDKLDEAPSAYKDIDLVMSQQADLVRVLKTLKPVVSIKG